MAEEIEEIKQEESLATEENTDMANETYEQIQEDEEFIKKKKMPLKKILIYFIAFLLLIILILTVLYFLGFFNKTEKIVETKKEVVQKVEEKKSYDFNIKDINSKKLNRQLEALTNKNIYQDKLEERQKLEDEKRLLEEQKKKEQEAFNQKEKKLLEEKELLEKRKLELEKQKLELENLRKEAILIKEQMQNSKNDLEKKILEETVKTPATPKKEIQVEKKNMKDDFLILINVAKIKGNLYKSYLDKILAINKDVKLCRDEKNKIEIYFGPFDDTKQRESLLDKLLKSGFKQSYEVELTKEEYNKRCNY